MKFRSAAFLLVGSLFWAACGTSRDYRTADVSSEKAYKRGKTSAQLKENELLGLKDGKRVDDNDIARILDETRSFTLHENSSLLVVQSGAEHPDNEMVNQLAKHFSVIPYTGNPSTLRDEAGGSISQSLRLAAAHGKAETILVYWPHLEMKRDDLPTGIVSWVPVVDFMVPDEYQKVRMHLKAALIDVRTGQWTTFRTEPIEEQTLTTRYAREKAPEWALGPVKGRAYQVCVRRLLDGYAVARQ